MEQTLAKIAAEMDAAQKAGDYEKVGALATDYYRAANPVQNPVMEEALQQFREALHEALHG